MLDSGDATREALECRGPDLRVAGEDSSQNADLILHRGRPAEVVGLLFLGILFLLLSVLFFLALGISVVTDHSYLGGILLGTGAVLFLILGDIVFSTGLVGLAVRDVLVRPTGIHVQSSSRLDDLLLGRSSRTSVLRISWPGGNFSRKLPWTELRVFVGSHRVARRMAQRLRNLPEPVTEESIGEGLLLGDLIEPIPITICCVRNSLLKIPLEVTTTRSVALELIRNAAAAGGYAAVLT